MSKVYAANEQGDLVQTETQDVVSTYTLAYLLEQKKQLEENLFCVNALIAEADKVGIKIKEEVI